MKKENFLALINAITGREFMAISINKKEVEEIKPESEFYIFRILPTTGLTIKFVFKSPKNEENIIRSFISQFCKKYREPNPAYYTGNYFGRYEKTFDWSMMSDEKKERCYLHHSSNMFSEKKLMEQIKNNFEKSEITDIWCRHGFYPTIYGIGIFVVFASKYELEAIKKLETYLQKENIPFSNEYSNARWVYRFVLKINREIHSSILKGFNSYLKS